MKTIKCIDFETISSFEFIKASLQLSEELNFFVLMVFLHVKLLYLVLESDLKQRCELFHAFVAEETQGWSCLFWSNVDQFLN